MRYFLLCAALALGGAACRKPNRLKQSQDAVRAVADRHRTEAGKIFQALEAAAGQALPPVPGRLLSPGAPLTLDNTLVVPADAALVHKLWNLPADFLKARGDYSWLTLPSALPAGQVLAGPAGEDDLTRQLEARMADQISEADIDRTKQRAEQAFVDLARLRYVLVVKTLTYAGATGEHGHVSADAYLYDLAGKDFGGVHIEAKNSASVAYQVTQDEHGNEVQNDLSASLKSDLDGNARKALEDAVAAQLPASHLPCARSVDAWCTWGN